MLRCCSRPTPFYVRDLSIQEGMQALDEPCILIKYVTFCDRDCLLPGVPALLCTCRERAQLVPGPLNLLAWGWTLLPLLGFRFKDSCHGTTHLLCPPSKPWGSELGKFLDWGSYGQAWQPEGVEVPGGSS